MTLQLKPLTSAGIERAIERANYFRLLNEPAQAESTCLDILHTDPGNQRALIQLLLALSDQFPLGVQIDASRIDEILSRITDKYEQIYLRGVVLERRARAKLEQGLPHAGSIAYGLCRQAMELYEQAENCRPAGNDDALLRWNACARMIVQHRLEAIDDDEQEQTLE